MIASPVARAATGWGRTGRSALAVAALSLAACPGPRQQDTGPERPTPPVPSDRPSDSGLPWEPASPGGVSDPDSGATLTLPDGWEVRPGSVPALWEARGPAWSDPAIRMVRWSGSVEPLIAEFDAADAGWLSSGPYRELESVADGPVFYGSREDRPDAISVGWYIVVDGVGVGVEADLPQAAFEAAWRSADQIVRTLRRGARP